MDGAFVIQFHQCDQGDHYDLMFECGQALTTFQLPVPLREMPAGVGAMITRLPDHRRAYLSYEGPISGGRGCVTIVDRGVYMATAATDDLWVVRLAGECFSGCVEIRRIEADCYRLVRFPEAGE